jgi:hypothetical protein
VRRASTAHVVCRLPIRVPSVQQAYTHCERREQRKRVAQHRHGMSISILVAFFLLAQGLGDSEDEIRL